MILNHRPLRGALFGSAFPPNDELGSIARVSGPNMVLFYQNFEVILLSPHLRTIWHEAALGSNKDRFRAFLEEIVAPAEKLHLSGFWGAMQEEAGNYADLFLLRTGRVREVSILGLAFFGFPWGQFLIVVPGEDPGRVREILKYLSAGRFDHPWQVLDRWVEDSETEFLLTRLLGYFPDEFRKTSGFLRTMRLPVADDRIQTYEIAYRHRNRKWHRDITDGPLLWHPKPGEPSWKRPGGKGSVQRPGSVVPREKGVRVGNEIMINFTVFLGGVFPLGDLSVPSHVLSGGGLVRINRFIREISTEIVSHAQALTSDHYRFCRFWTESGFAVEGMEEIARIVDPVGWRNIMVLPFWETSPTTLSEIHSTRRVSDPFFVDPKKNMGALLLRGCSEWHARNVVFRRFRDQIGAEVEPPVTVGRFLSGA